MKTVVDYFSGIELEGGTAVLKSKSTPAANGGPEVAASGNTIVINGGTSRVALSSTAPMAKVLVRVDGIDGFYIVTPAASAMRTTSPRASPASAPATFRSVYRGM